MTDNPRTLTSMTTTGLIVGAVGIAILWASGIEFPFYPPPGILILGSGAIFLAVAANRFWWTPAVGAFLGLFVVVGFLVAGFVKGESFDNLALGNGTGPFIGQAIQLIGVATAFIAGTAATAQNRRHRNTTAA